MASTSTRSLLETYRPGTKAWFPDLTEGWISAEVVGVPQTSGDLVKVQWRDDRDKTFDTELDPSRPDELPPLRNPPRLETQEDLTSLSYLNEPSVLHSIKTRYASRYIYTYSGIVLVAVNPFANVVLYDSSYVQLYAGRRKEDNEPHLFAIAEEAYRCMMRDSRDQTIIVSGESGAGKTVSAKYIMRYFATVDDPERPGRRKITGKDGVGMSEVEEQILSTNPIMEAFGNAKTTRNNNSSRFGKYIEILFDPSQTIIGARIRTYLLERSRLVYQPDTERNYHIFYQLIAGAPSSERRSLGLEDAAQFHYLNQGGAENMVIPGVNDAAEFKDTQKALSTVGITIERQWSIFKLLAALLHLGNIKITSTRTEALLADDDPSLVFAAKLLGLEKKIGEFKKWIIKKQIVTRSESIVTGLTAPQAIVVRDSVAKFVYSCLFDWLVAVVNESLYTEGVDDRVKNFIGVLDIYGFEHFKKNSFEQFCINYANEKLQQEFNAHVFKLEQAEYVTEKINWTFIDFSDNQPCIDLIESKLGILSLLDEESRLPSGTDASFAQKLYSQLGKPEHSKVFKKPRFGTTAFTIAHYALDVTYETEGFLEKNKDTVPDEQLALLNSTDNGFLKEVLDRALAINQASKHDSVAIDPSAVSGGMVNKRASVMGGSLSALGGRKGGGAPKKPTLGSTFKASLISLMDTIDNTNAHYIRCIKPNEAKQAWEMDPQMVLAQLRACGVLETIRISCAGYPTRQSFEEFIERYYMLIPSKEWGPDIKKLCTMILERSIPLEDKYQVGLTKIFLRAGMLAEFEKLRSDRLNALATVVQKNFKRYMGLKRYRHLKETVVGLQATFRRTLAVRALQRALKEKAALRIQSAARAFIERRKFVRARKVIIDVQRIARGFHIRRTFQEKKKEMGAIILQSLLRGAAARRIYQLNRKRIVLLQSCVRRKQARTELKTLKNEARSVTHFKEVSYKLENKVVELTQTLQKRTQENKELQSKLKNLEQQLQQWMAKYDEADAKVKELNNEVSKPTVALPEFQALDAEKRELDSQLETSLKKIADQDAQIQRLTDDFTRQMAEMEERQKTLDTAVPNGAEDSGTIATLRQELSSLREQLSRVNAIGGSQKNQPVRMEGPAIFNMATGRPPAENGIPAYNGVATAAANVLPGKRGRARSITSDPVVDERAAFPEHQMRPATLAFPEAPLPLDDEQAREDEIIRLLLDEDRLDQDVLEGLIRNLRIPTPSLQNLPSSKEVLFPAHLISLITNEMWKYSLMRESERFLANVMQTIQGYVMSFQGEDAIVPGIFWLSNVHEIWSFVCVAESDMNQGIAPRMQDDFDWEVYERLVTIVKHDLESLEYNIYHTWMQETKKKLQKMVVPALVESQSLPGFVTNDGGGRLFNRLLQGNSAPAFTMDDILNLLNKVWKSLKSFYVEHSVVQQVVTELLKLIGVTSFNDLLMRRNFSSWKRAMQIQYNCTRVEEWCKTHDIPEGNLQLEHLIQATKLLQLKKATVQDIEILFDVCWMLTPTQIQKLINNYQVADYENPISPEIMRAVAARIQPQDKNDHLMLPSEEEAGQYEVPLPREVTGIETYIPAWLNVPQLKRVVSRVL